MITIIHGEDTVSSRNYYLSQKEKSKNLVEFKADKLSFSDLIQTMEGGSLFNEEKEIFIEGFLGKKSSPDFEKIIKYLSKKNDGFKIFLWEGSEVSRTALNHFRDSIITFEKIQNIAFYFN